MLPVLEQNKDSHFGSIYSGDGGVSPALISSNILHDHPVFSVFLFTKVPRGCHETLQQTARTDLLFELHPQLFYSLGRANLVQQIQVYYLQCRTQITVTSLHTQMLVHP